MLWYFVNERFEVAKKRNELIEHDRFPCRTLRALRKRWKHVRHRFTEDRRRIWADDININEQLTCASDVFQALMRLNNNEHLPCSANTSLYDTIVGSYTNPEEYLPM